MRPNLEVVLEEVVQVEDVLRDPTLTYWNVKIR